MKLSKVRFEKMQCDEEFFNMDGPFIIIWHAGEGISLQDLSREDFKNVLR
jgi:hypothetical protein